MSNKKAYFQGGGGVNEPAPKEKKYKSDPALLIQPRFKEPLFKNYDLYETPGEHSPGAGFYQNMDKYDSVKDFIQQKRERNSKKYKADDSWIQDDGSLTSTPNKKKSARRISLLLALIKNSKHKEDNNNTDFLIDDQVTPILGESGSYGDSAAIGVGAPLADPDAEGKSSDQLDYGRDYTDDVPEGPKEADIEQLIEKYREPDGLYGLPDGLPNEPDTKSNRSQEYGITDSGNTLYSAPNNKKLI